MTQGILKATIIIIGILCMLYGIMVLMAGSGTIFWVIWEIIGAAIIGSLWIRESGLINKIPKYMVYGVRGLVVLGMLYIIVCCILMGTQFSSNGEKDLDYIIVLGAQVRTTGPSIVLKYRLDKAVEYLNDNPDTTCIVSGGQGGNEPTAEASVMRDYLVDKGIDENRILVEDKSLNTIQNIEFSKKIIEDDCNGDYDNVGILSNNFHVFRGTAIARKQGLNGVCGIAASSHPRFLPNNMLRECFGILKDFIQGNM